MNKIIHNKNRVPVWDIIKFLTIVAVVWGHCIQGFLPTEGYESPIYRSIYSFHMPLFMMISGYFSISSMSLEIKPFIRKKFFQLIYPCITWGVIAWLLLEGFSSFHYGNNEVSLYGLFSDLYWIANFWFLKSCFICYLIAYWGIHYKAENKFWIPITFLISQAIPPFSVPFLYPCFLVGIILRQNEHYFNVVLTHTKWLILLFSIMLIFWDKNMWINSHGIPSGFLNAELQVWVTIIFCRLYRMTIGIVGSLAIISFIYNLFSNPTRGKLYSLCCEWGKYTLEIYVLHSIILEKIITPHINLGNIDTILFNLLIVPGSAMITILICVFFIIMIEKDNRLKSILWNIEKT